MFKSIPALLVLAVVGMLAAVGAAQANVITNQRVPIAFSAFVPCANGGAGEMLTGTIDVHDLTTSTVNGNNDSWQFLFEAHGVLVGAATADRYRLSSIEHGSYTNSLGTDHSTLTYVHRYRLIGPGPGNNLVVRETAHVTIDADENAVVQHDDFRIDCG